MIKKRVIPLVVATLLSLDAPSALAQDADPEALANEIELDLNAIEDPFFASSSVAHELAPQLFRIEDPKIRILTFSIVRNRNETIKGMEFYDLEENLAFQYLNSPDLRDKSYTERSGAIYRLQKENLLSWPGLGDVYHALLFDHLLHSEDLQKQSPVEKLTYLENLEVCPFAVKASFQRMFYWQAVSKLSAGELEAFNALLERQGINSSLLNSTPQ